MLRIRNPYIFSIVLATVFGWASWIVVINKISPFSTTVLALSLFYFSLFIALTGTFALLVYYLRMWLKKDDVVSTVHVALREGVLLGLLVCVGLLFQRLRVLTWWDGLLLFAIVFLIEFYFTSRD